jgi:hypothetical membrane protein
VSNTLIKQAQFIPFTAMLITILAGFMVPGYASFSQHVSELGIINHPAAAIMPIAAIIAGASICLFGLGLLLHKSKAFGFSALTAIIFGISFASAGIYPTGTAMHGLYGLTMFYVLVPACFAAELPSANRTRFLVNVSLLAALLPLIYMWGLLSGLEPHAYRGFTQRLGILVIFGWYPVASYMLLRSHTSPNELLGLTAQRGG